MSEGSVAGMSKQLLYKEVFHLHGRYERLHSVVDTVKTGAQQSRHEVGVVHKVVEVQLGIAG